jgi:hypothetical protein
VIIRYDIEADAFSRQDLSHLAITAEDIADLTCAFRRIGFWRADIASGLVYWSEGLFRIFEMEECAGPISVSAANGLIHPDDVVPLYELFEQAIVEKSAFHFILRLRTRGGIYRFVRSVGRYRPGPQGKDELFGMLYEIFEPIRTVALAAYESPERPPSTTR